MNPGVSHWQQGPWSSPSLKGMYAECRLGIRTSFLKSPLILGNSSAGLSRDEDEGKQLF